MYKRRRSDQKRHRKNQSPKRVVCKRAVQPNDLMVELYDSDHGDVLVRPVNSKFYLSIDAIFGIKLTNWSNQKLQVFVLLENTENVLYQRLHTIDQMGGYAYVEDFRFDENTPYKLTLSAWFSDYSPIYIQTLNLVQNVNICQITHYMAASAA